MFQTPGVVMTKMEQFKKKKNYGFWMIVNKVEKKVLISIEIWKYYIYIKFDVENVKFDFHINGFLLEMEGIFKS